eukprot:14209311-Alexandrium_andersonii.AAC.1
MSHSDDPVEIPLSPLQAAAVLSARHFAVDCVLRDETPSEHADLQEFVDACGVGLPPLSHAARFPALRHPRAPLCRDPPRRRGLRQASSAPSLAAARRAGYPRF